MIDPQAGVKLIVPQMEKVGKLRQSSTPKEGMTYWMAFLNPTLAVNVATEWMSSLVHSERKALYWLRGYYLNR